MYYVVLSEVLDSLRLTALEDPQELFHALIHYHTAWAFTRMLSSPFTSLAPGLGRRLPISNDDSFDSFGLTSRLTLNRSNLMQTPCHIVSECKVDNERSHDDVPIGPASTSSVLLCKEMRQEVYH